MASKGKPPLHVVGTTGVGVDKPPPGLGAAGTDLWRRITSAYSIDDEGGRELLFQACAQCDRVAELKARIDCDGPVVVTRAGPREHPLLRAELQGRSFIARTLGRLGLDVEPLRSGPGRPGIWS